MKTTDLKRLMALTGRKCTLPIIEKTALIFRGTATSTNLETTLTVKTDIKGEGVIDLNAVKSAGKYDSAWIEGETLHIKKGTGIMKSSVRKAEEFPEVPHTPLSSGNITLSDVERMQRVVKYAGSDELRPTMNGLYTNGKHFVATDANKLAWDFCRGKDIPEVIIPKAAVNMLENTAYNIKIGLNEPEKGDPHIINIAFINSDETLVTRVIEGRYPSYKAVIPRLSDIRVIASTEELKRAVNGALPFSNKSTFQGRFRFAQPGKLTISSCDIDFANEFSETIDAVFDGAKEFVVGFNLKFMKEILATIDTKTIELLMSEPNRAGIINKKYLIMPVMLDEENQRIELETKPETKPAFEKGQFVNVFDDLLGENHTGKITEIHKPVADGRIAYTVEYPSVNFKGEPSSEKIWAWENFITLADVQPETPGTVKTWENYYEHLPQLPGFINRLCDFEEAFRKGGQMDLSRAVCAIAGPGSKDYRQNFMEWLTGTKQPKAKCGINAIEKSLLQLFSTVSEAPTEPIEESPIIAEAEIGKIPEEKATPNAEPETPNAEPETPNLIVMENLTERAFAIVGSLDLLPEEFRAKYGSPTKLKIGDDRLPGLMFSKKRRDALAEMLTASGIQFLSM